MKTDKQILKILFYPAKYIDSSHIPDSIGTSFRENDYLINHWIINQFMLPFPSDIWESPDVLSSLFINNWQNLRFIAELIGAHITRTHAFNTSTLFFSDKRLQAFISLPLKYHVEIISHVTNRLSYGIVFLRMISEYLPTYLKSRLALCFPKELSLPLINITPTPMNINLLKMAIIYAKKN